MVNKQIELGGIIIPFVTNDEGVNYYPVKYVLEQFLLKRPLQLHTKDNLKSYIKRYEIDYSFKGTTPQETYCMNRDGWKEYFKKGKKNKNKTNDKIKRMKLWCEYLNIEYKDTVKKEYDIYTLKCIEEFRKKSPKAKMKTCISCERELPNSVYFYTPDSRSIQGTLNVCKECSGWSWTNDNKEYKYIYDNFGLSGFEKYLKNKIEFIIQNSIIGKYKFNMDYIKSHDEKREIILKISKYLVNNNIINKYDLSVNKIKEYLINIEITSLKSLISNNVLIDFCTDNDGKNRHWLYKKYVLGSISIDDGVAILKKYIRENNIIIEDKFNYKDWSKLLEDSRLRQFSGNVLEFIVGFYNYEYAGYKFNISSSNYYKSKENMIFDMKYLVEKDMNIEIEKIPLYITKYTLRKKSNALYNALTKKKVYNNLFEWINDCYPNKFIEADFNLNPYRSKFDSLEEAQVDEQLRLRFKGVIYNCREESDKVEFYGMIPDWIIPTYKGCYLVEYYGLWQEKESKTSHRLQRYKKTHDNKIIKYKKLEEVGYKHLGIYPNDLKNNFEGLHKKIDEILK